MLRTLWWILALIVVLPAMTARAGEVSDEEARAEAHRTILRRLSALHEAGTEKLGLTEKGRAFVDLFLDVARNCADVRARRAPSSTLFRGTPHAQPKPTKTHLRFEACFMNLVIDVVELPWADLPAVIDAALDAKRFQAASLERDGEDFDGWRLNMLAGLAIPAHEKLPAANKDWQALRSQVADTLIAALPGEEPFYAHGALRCLQTIGNDRIAKALMARADELADSVPHYQHIGYARTVFGMPGAAGKRFAREALTSEKPDLVAAALSALAKDPDKKTWAFLEAAVATDTETPAGVRSEAISSLARLKTKKAQRILERLFDEAGTERERYSMACSVTRSGSSKAIPYLRKKLAEFEENRDVSRAHVVRNLLKKHDTKSTG